MTNAARQHERRSDALSKARIVEAAAAILDEDGEAALTFRSLAARLNTGSGAIYWHVANKHDLLGAVTEVIITDAITGIEAGPDPKQAIRRIALGVYDAIEDHPWLGTHLSAEPWQTASLQILQHVGEQLQALGLPDSAQFDVASALLHYLLGLAAQHAAVARLAVQHTDRDAFLASVATRLQALDAGEHSFVRRMTEQLRTHDDREQFLFGVDLYLAGVAAQL